MQRIRIVNRAADFSFTQKFVEGIALFDANGVLVVDVLESFGSERRHDAGNLREEPVVFRGVRLAGALPIRKMAQLYPQNGSLDFIEAAVPAGLGAQIFCRLAMIAQRSNARREFSGIRDDHSRVAVRAQIFRGVKTEAGNVAERAGAPAFVRCADGLRVVFDYWELARFCERDDGV